MEQVEFMPISADGLEEQEGPEEFKLPVKLIEEYKELNKKLDLALFKIKQRKNK